MNEQRELLAKFFRGEIKKIRYEEWADLNGMEFLDTSDHCTSVSSLLPNCHIEIIYRIEESKRIKGEKKLIEGGE